MSKNVISQYLDNYAEEEINYIPELDYVWDEVISIPCYNEFEEIIDLLETNLPGVIKDKKVLVIINVNASKISKESFIKTNINFINYLKDKTGIDNKEIISFASFPNFDILLIDRTTGDRLFDSKSGVGLARKIGADVALKLYYQGKIKSKWIRTTDADVILSDSYLDISPNKNYSAINYSFYHQLMQDNSQGLALQLYEIYLRYYYLGLIYAQSPFAFHTVGSSMSISGEHYAKVRGFPWKREAAEDFYMLNKLAKIGKIYRDTKSIINIKGRESERVPFGTGASMAKISNLANIRQEYLIYSPIVFEYIKNIYKVFNVFAEDMSFESIEELIVKYDLQDIFNEFKLKDVLNNCLKMSKDSYTLNKHINTWFDAFKTLKVINYLSRNKYEMSVWSDALKQASFIPEVNFNDDLEKIRENLYLFERVKTEELFVKNKF